MTDLEERQARLCREYGAAYVPTPPELRVGIALQTLGSQPLNGLRLPPEGSTCGWYLWGGVETDEHPDFYQPLCVQHLPERCPLALPFLGLPPGWRFLTDGTYVDVWYDPELLAHLPITPPASSL